MANESKMPPAGTPNHLIHEKSPYLLLHATNPVEWFPWGEEAFSKARREQKPILLSIGYYTCHWCHVMERESFSNPAIAEILNRHFVSIKVDREERPDVDRIYMGFVQATTGAGGWPLDVFLTPDLKPFFGGTYWPPEDSFGRPGFRKVLERVADAWEKERESLEASASEVTAALAQMSSAESGANEPLGESVLEKACAQLRASYDSVHGGFGGAPKFPRPVIFNFLLRYHARTGDREALQMTLHTLRAMARGGMHDALGGGFHRYATDERWHVPHFEKMLYDQAQLAASYTEAFQITHNAFYARLARDVLGFVLAEMRDAAGGFYSAQDADSQIETARPEHAEGAFYVWRADEIEKILGVDAAKVFAYVYGVEPDGNVPHQQDAHGELTGKNVLYERSSAAEAAKDFGKSAEETEALLASARAKLLEARAQRPRPPTDDKIVTAWNGLTISALARAAQALEDSRYSEAAQGAARFVETELYDPASGRLRRRFRAGDSAVAAFLDDYAAMIRGLLDLYETDFDFHWLDWAVRLQEKQDELFWDAQAGGYFAVGAEDASILFRTREGYDGAEPSPNSLAALNLLRLREITGRAEWKRRAEQTFAAFGRRLALQPEVLPEMAAALGFALTPPRQIVIAGAPAAADTRSLLSIVQRRFLPGKILLLADGGEGQKQLARWQPALQAMQPQNGRAAAYLCENFVCHKPLSDPQALEHLLDAGQ
jgi:uncharacterized protein